MIVLNINNESRTVNLPDDTPLLWVLRDELQLTGTKYGCGMAFCGACTVHVDGKPALSCSTPISILVGKKITTIEAMADDKIGQKIQEAWQELDVAQCGYCQSGQIMTAVAFLKQNPKPDDSAIEEAMRGNLCRCGTYTRINAAIKQAASKIEA